MTTTPEPHQTDLREYLRVLRARKWEIILITLVLVLATMAFTIKQTPIYQGEAKVLVNAVQNPANPLLVSQPNLDTERQLVLSQAVALSVQKDRAPGTSLHALTDGLSAEVITNTSVLVVRYASTSPSTAAALSNAFAQAYVDFRTNQALNQYQAAQDAVNAQIDGVKKDLATLGHQIDATTDPTELDNLQAQRDSLVARLGVLQQQLSTLVSNATVAQGTAAQIVQRAEVPTSPSSPNKARNGVLALFAGVMLGIGFAFLRERLDDRVKGRQDIE